MRMCCGSNPCALKHHLPAALTALNQEFQQYDPTNTNPGRSAPFPDLACPSRMKCATGRRLGATKEAMEKLVVSVATQCRSDQRID
jgi:hypothetical protein